MTVSELQLQPLTQAQLEAVVELDRVCLGGLWTLEGYQRELESPNSELLVLSVPSAAANEAGSSQKGQSPPLLGLGCFWAIVEEAHITLLAIHPDYHRQGLGQFLLLALLEKAVQRGLERATLEVRVSNEAAIALYQKLGFRIAGRRKGYYQKTQEDALILWLGGLQDPKFLQNLKIWQQKGRDRLPWKLPENPQNSPLSP
ncbi:ribosomal protein S18-alanine N-acetyltransferase [Spirulina sp. CS-785/01]|uniref:ribosomal protein S18-alanine N-acetyltransferase n=1 Tax=Spirulina sp. CS-785/01 TaxID=3021716 RepID=UPI00232DF836|nr:ribosomal protein S18-alanine N-acetyltransferase [Spirulina sp. CS-785/01]MDB9312031.1 ribosomal protein S18-alanine N-acetyltransferase [Spirulina sp. CS-785/01]